MAPLALVDVSSTTMPSKGCEKKNLVLDMGGVLLRYDGGTSEIAALINPKLFAHMLQDTIWDDYDTGKLADEYPYDQLSRKFGVPAKNIESALKVAIEEMNPIPEMQKIVSEYRGKVRLFLMTNVPNEEFEYLYKKFPEIFQDFEKIFTSAATGMRKPSLNFFRHVIQEAGIDPNETIFVDDTFQNCAAAHSLGMTAVLCESIESAVQQLHFLLRTDEDRVAAAQRYLDRVLEHDRQDLYTITSKGARLSDNLSEFYIVEVLGDDRFFPDLPIPENLEYCYTRETDMSKWTLFPLPNDLNTTSVGMSVLYLHNKVSLEYINSAVDHMLEFQSEDGIIQTYYDNSRLRTCHTVLANVTMLFHCAGRRLPPASEEFLYNVLRNKAYLEGSQYFIGPAPFLYFLSRTAAKFRDNHLLPSDFIPLLTYRVQELMGTQSGPLALAMVILACLNLQIDPDVGDVKKLARAQNADGSWEMDYWLEGNVLSFGCKALTAAFGLAALQRVQDRRQSELSQPEVEDYTN